MKLITDLNDVEDIRSSVKLLNNHLHGESKSIPGTLEIHGFDDDNQPPDSSAELDAECVPWDERIHASTKTKTKKGVWKRKKGVDGILFDNVMAELKSVDVQATETSAPPAPPTPPTSLNDDDEFLHQGVKFTVNHLRNSGWSDEQILDLERVENTEDVTATPPPPPTTTTFPMLMEKITAANLSDEVVNNACVQSGVQSLVLLSAQPQLVPIVESILFPDS